MSKAKCTKCGAAGPGEDGLCKPCRIEKNEGPEARREYFAELGRKGAEQANKNRGPQGLDPDALPPLNSHEAAEIWLDVIGRAVASGQLENRDGQAAIRAVDTWIKARAEKQAADDLQKLRERMEELQAQIEEQQAEPWQE